ncbi:phage terminase small subunit [Pseudoalteromonas nigrifaciens]|uniref:phage terminase small subunit n=1 Tax=Pseudoalteromonas nigrifaciens TaxID=28109 RepID=UPI000B77FEF4|nr:phage terminase small subunit [Pseudoalteromonas nigrifaciens]
MELEDDLKRLKSYVTRADKITHKREVLLPKWLPIVEDYLAKKGKQNEDNPIFAYCTIWMFDVGNFARGLEFGFRAIEFNQPMASSIRRKWPGFIADTVFDWAQTQAEKGHSIEPYFGQVFSNVANHWKLPEQVTAKYYKFAGLALLRSKNGDISPSTVGDVQRLQQADGYLAKAAELHKHAQVKTVRNKIAMRLRAIAELNAQ